MKLDLSISEKKYLQSTLSFAEAEKYIKKFNNKIFVIKYGGSALSDRYLANNFAKDLVLIKKLGINVVIVHGGGMQISETLKAENLITKFKNGLRVTDKKHAIADFISTAPRPIKELFFIFPPKGSTAHCFLFAGTTSTCPAKEK